MTVRAVVGLSALTVLGIGVMGFLAYGAASAGDIVYLLAYRLWMSGDTYVYAYQWEGLSSLRGNYDVNFLSYMLHPLSSLVGIRAYEKPLGSMLASEVTGQDVLTGPNPQLPVLLDYFFSDALVTTFLIAFMIGFLVIGFRPAAIALAKSRSRFLGVGAVAAAVFCPPAGFLDTSQVLITFVGILAVTAGGVLLELLLARQRPEPSGVHSADPGNISRACALRESSLNRRNEFGSTKSACIAGCF